jgi:hypothetical protein
LKSPVTPSILLNKDKQTDNALDQEARDVHSNTLEAATFARLPNINEYKFNEPIRLSTSRTDARSAERMEKIAEFAKRMEGIKDKDTYGRLLTMSLCIAFAEFLWEILQEKGHTFNPNSTRPSQSKQKKYGKWDVDRNDLSTALDTLLQINPLKIRESDAKRFMKEIHRGKDSPQPRNYKIRNVALQMWYVAANHDSVLLTVYERRLGSKLCIFRDEAGPAALMFLTLGPPSLPQYSLDI